MPKLSRVRQLAAKIETTEGTEVSLAAADAKLLIYDAKVKFDPSMFKRQPLRSSLSQLTMLPGLQKGTLTGRLEIRGSGTNTTAPEWFKLMRAGGFSQHTTARMTIGAVTSGPFQHWEVITGGTSLATGRVVFPTANGAAAILVVVLTGTFQSAEVITGGTSGATATTSSTAASYGIGLKPTYVLAQDATGSPSLSMGTYEDGLLKKIKGARGKTKLSFKNGEPAFVEFEFLGAGGATPVTDTALLSITHETTVPPVFMSAAATLGTYAPVFSEIGIDLAQTVALRESANEATGLLSTVITNREPTITMNPEVASVADYPIFTEWLAATERALDFTLGSAAGNRFRVHAPKMQVSDIDDGDRDSLALNQVTGQLNENFAGLEDEVFILSF